VSVRPLPRPQSPHGPLLLYTRAPTPCSHSCSPVPWFGS